MNTVRFALAAILLGTLGLAEGQRNWKDEAEQKLFGMITAERDGAKRYSLLSEWQNRYPQTEFIRERAVMLFTAEVARGDSERAEVVGRELLKIEPVAGSLLIVQVAPALSAPSPGILDLTAKCATALTTIAAFADVSATRVLGAQESKAQLTSVANNALGWVALYRKDFRAAETALTQSLQANPAQGQVSLTLAVAIGNQQDPERLPDALYHLARAAYYDGTGALPQNIRDTLDTRLRQVFDGAEATSVLANLRETAKGNPFPAKRTPSPAMQAASAPQTKPQPAPEPAFEDFETYYRRRMSPRRQFFADMFNGMSAGVQNRPMVTTRERLYQQWLDEQKLKAIRGVK